MGALQHVDVPGYNALLIRDTYQNLTQAEGLIPRSFEWLGKTDAFWNGERHEWKFPSGATVGFGHLKDQYAHFNYSGGAWQYIGFDEVSTIPQDQYRFVGFSRRRKPKHGPLSEVPLRTRSASNPVGPHVKWVYRRLVVDYQLKGRLFIPSFIYDNPGLDEESYREGLAELDPVTRAQIESGDWRIRPGGGFFRRTMFHEIDGTWPIGRNGQDLDLELIRFWDIAATEPSPSNPDPDYTVGTLVGRDPERRGCILNPDLPESEENLIRGVEWYVLDVVRGRWNPGGVESVVKDTAYADGFHVEVYFEQEPGSSGKSYVYDWLDELPEHAVYGLTSSGDKVTRAKPVSARADKGRIAVVRAGWNEDWYDELESFPDGADHDDQVDSFSGAFRALSQVGGRISEGDEVEL